jgi:hypothetical protein
LRIGTNPEKSKGERNQKKQHRVVVVFYIPNQEEDYYKESLEVLDTCLNSLVNTINFDTTNITLINNNSFAQANPIIQKYIDAKQIDKYVLYNENRGKVYAIINEVRGIFEDFVTISDSDVLFFSGWEQAVIDIFNQYPKAGVVSPLPSQHCAFYNNVSVFFDNYFFGRINYAKLVNEYDTDLYLKGVNNKDLINKKGKFNWKEKQYYLNKKTKAIIGATHFVATYKSIIFKNQTSFPEIKFSNGYENDFIDILADKMGLYRLSTLNTFAYHIGNSIDEIAQNPTFNPNLTVNSNKIILQNSKNNYSTYTLRKFVFKILKKIKFHC